MMILSFLLVTMMVSADKLMQIQSLWRHGARTPIYCNWNCQYFKERGWLDGYLTPTGMRQHYILGMWMRKQYIETDKLLSEVFNLHEIEVVSTDVNRTIMSVMSNMQGMYPAGSGPEIPVVEQNYLKPPSIDIDVPAELQKSALPHQIQVVPVHMKEQMQDQELRGYGTPVCPASGKWQIDNKNSELSKNVTKAAQKLLINFSNEMDIDPSTMDIFTLSEWQDTFDSSLFNGFDMPKNLKPETLKESQKIYPLSIALKLYQTPEQVNIMSSPFFIQLIKNMKSAIKGEQYYKYHIYSAHDVTVQLIAIALNMTSSQCLAQWYMGETVDNPNCITEYPTYATNMLFELWSNDEEQYYVKLRYNGEYVNICDGKSTQCKLTDLEAILKNQERDFNRDCELNIDPTIQYKVPTWMITLTIIFLILLIACIFLALKMVINLKKIHQASNLMVQNQEEERV